MNASSRARTPFRPPFRLIITSSSTHQMTHYNGSTMKQLLSVIALVLAISAGAVAHEGNDHVRGVVTAVSAQSVTVELADKTTKTLSISAKTALEASGKAAKLADLKVGDRVVIDVPEHTANAVLIKVGAKK